MKKYLSCLLLLISFTTAHANQQEGVYFDVFGGTNIIHFTGQGITGARYAINKSSDFTFEYRFIQPSNHIKSSSISLGLCFHSF